MANNQDLVELESMLEYSFEDKKLLEEALTHKSCKKEYNNERLEFLGDAVLDLIVGEYLYKNFPNLAEGNLSKLRASLVNEKGFEKLAKLLKLGSFVRISQAEENNKGRTKSSILANCFEAVMGAIYLEVGVDKVKQITLKLLDKAYEKIDLESVFKDYKTTLQELTQGKLGVIPTYTVVKTSGPDHNKEFTVELTISDKVIDRATGKSKKEAQQNVAKKALEKLKKI